MNKQAYYNMMKVAALMKAAEDKNKPYSALDINTGKIDYRWPVDKDPQIGNYPYDRGGYLRQLAELRGLIDKDAAPYDKAVYDKNLAYGDLLEAVSKSNDGKWYPGAGLERLRRNYAGNVAAYLSPRGSLPNRTLLKAFRQSGDIKHKHWLKTNRIRPVSPDLITVPGFKDIFKAATPEDKKFIQYYLNTTAQNKGKGHGNVV